MPDIQLSAEQLHSRSGDLTRLLRPLLRNPTSIRSASGPYNGFQAVGAYGGGAQPPNPRDWRVGCVAQLSANLYELWQPYGKSGRFYLHSFCLNLYDTSVGNQDPPEYLLLHADPETKLSDPHGRYKKGPHLHIAVAETVWPDVHLGLNLGNLREATSSATNLTIAVAHAVRMIAEQVVALREDALQT